MTVEETVKQLRRRDGTQPLILDEKSLSPVCHVGEPVGRESVLQSLVEYVEPAFDGELPPNAYVWGPMGAGKSAVVTALFTQLQRQLSRPGSPRHTATGRQDRRATPLFGYVDARRATTEFSLYRAVLNELVDDPVPKRGVETDSLLTRLQERLAPDSRAVVAVDHVGEPETHSLSALAELLDTVESSLSWLAVGRSNPAQLDTAVRPDCLQVPAYRRRTLAEIVGTRAAKGLGEQGIRDDQLERIVTWSTNAHDALAVLTGAAGLAARRDRSRVRDADIGDAIADIPQPGVSLARVLRFRCNRRQVLGALVSVPESERTSMASAVESIAARVDLAATTVERYLYELADAGVLDRSQPPRPADGSSRLRPRFSPTVFEALSEPAEVN